MALFAMLGKNSDNGLLKGIGRLTDPAGIWGGNKGMSADQKAANMLTGGFSGLIGQNKDNFITKGLEDASLFGTSANQKQANVDSFGNTPRPYLSDYGQMDLTNTPVQQSIWARYNPRG